MVSLVVWVAALGVLFVKSNLIKQYFEALPGYNVNDSDENGIVGDFEDLLRTVQLFFRLRQFG